MENIEELFERYYGFFCRRANGNWQNAKGDIGEFFGRCALATDLDKDTRGTHDRRWLYDNSLAKDWKNFNCIYVRNGRRSFPICP